MVCRRRVGVLDEIAALQRGSVLVALVGAAHLRDAVVHVEQAERVAHLVDERVVGETSTALDDYAAWREMREKSST